MMPKIGETVTVFVSGRHDFRRQARVLSVQGDEMLVRYANHAEEWIPARWL